MATPGSNILNRALRIIAAQSFEYYKFLSRAVNDIGLDVAIYAYPLPTRGSVQAVPRNLFEQYGLEFNKQYLMFYVSQSILDVTRDVSGDQIAYAGNRYQCLSKTDWLAQDGWVGVISVLIPSPS